jgi:GDPmannose 4,6-dehydratase
MSKRIAFITGISGQDGSYLTEHLLSLGYEVHGIVRRNSVPEHQESRIDHLAKDINVYYGDMLDVVGLKRIIEKINFKCFHICKHFSWIENIINI